MTLSIADADVRRRALDPLESFAVSAPAGSGKTELLIRRYLVLLAQVSKPEEILAITFTRKAATEMTQRILQALNDASSGEAFEDPHKQETIRLAKAALDRDQSLGWNLLSSPYRMQIRTIDSFCHSIATAMPFDSGYLSSPQILEDPTPAYLQATIDLTSGTDGETEQPLGVLLSYYDNNLEQLANALADLLKNRTSWLPALIGHEFSRDHLEQLYADLVESKLEQASGLMGYWSTLQSLAAYAAENLAAAENLEAAEQLNRLSSLDAPLSADCADLPHWKSLCALLLTKDGSPRKQLNKTQGFPTEDVHGDKARATALKKEAKSLIEDIQKDEGLLKAVQAIPGLPNPEFAEDQWPVVDALLALLPRLAAQLELHFAATNRVDYPGEAIAAERALRTGDAPTRLAMQLDYRINHILVDEFQDTSTSQVSLLELLTEAWQPGDGRSLFIVGDGMQSIYGFRKANVGLFIRARQQGIGTVELTPLDLTSNFRSQAGLVEWVNQSFVNLFPSEEDIAHGQVRYHPSTPTRPATVTPTNTNLFVSPEEEAQQIAGQIGALQQEFPEQTIAVLVRARKHLEMLLPALRTQGIRWQGTDLEPLSERLCVSDIDSLVRVLHSPADRLGWLTLLRSPFVGLDMFDLYALCRHNYSAEDGYRSIGENLQQLRDIEGLSTAGAAILDRLSQGLQWAKDSWTTVPLRYLITRWWEHLGGPATLRDASEHADAHSYLELLEKHDESGMIGDWQLFRSRLEELYAKPNPDASGQLQIMTIHKAKGLEFDQVFVPRLEAGIGGNDSPLLLWWEREFESGETHFLLANKGSKSAQSDLYQYLKDEESTRRAEENVRLLYVACTRARQQLHLSGIAPVDKKGELGTPSANTLLAALWPALEDSFTASFKGFPTTGENGEITDESEAETLPLHGWIRRLPPDWRADWCADWCADSHGNLALPPSTEPELADPVQSSGANRWETSYQQRILGIALHEALQNLVELRHSGADVIEPDERDRWIGNRSILFDSQLKAKGFIDPAETEMLRGQFHMSLEATLNDPVGQWLLRADHKASAVELAFDYVDDQLGMRTAIVDRTFVDSQGTRWIVDYKSSSPDPDEQIDSFLMRQAESYRGQLNRYKSLFQDEQNSIRLMLYFPSLSRCCELLENGGIETEPDLSHR